MPVTKDQAHMLAALAVACRPYGAPTWDAPGVVAAIGKVAHLSLADVTLAVTRAAADATAKTPAVISATSSQHWAEKVTPPSAPSNPRPGEACGTCGHGESHRNHHMGALDYHHHDPRNQADPPPTTWAEARDKLRKATT